MPGVETDVLERAGNAAADDLIGGQRIDAQRFAGAPRVRSPRKGCSDHWRGADGQRPSQRTAAWLISTITGRAESLSLGLQKPVTATAAFLLLAATRARPNTGAGQGADKRTVLRAVGLAFTLQLRERVGIVVRARDRHTNVPRPAAPYCGSHAAGEPPGGARARGLLQAAR
jgi:hypothetical protein